MKMRSVVVLDDGTTTTPVLRESINTPVSIGLNFVLHEHFTNCFYHITTIYRKSKCNYRSFWYSICQGILLSAF